MIIASQGEIITVAFKKFGIKKLSMEFAKLKKLR
ncbi:MAG: hypothetical protein V1804_02635 [Patescibacteria group bacterium]